MKEPTTKQLQRLEKKKAKMAAFLEIARLNDKDKEAKMQALKQIVATDGSSNPNDSNMAGDNSTRKRSCEKNSDVTCSEICKEENVPDESELQDNNKKPRFFSKREVRKNWEEMLREPYILSEESNDIFVEERRDQYKHFKYRNHMGRRRFVTVLYAFKVSLRCGKTLFRRYTRLNDEVKEDQDKAKWKHAYRLGMNTRNGGTCVHAFFVRSTENQSGIGGLSRGVRNE
ncbi:uncharacterized protein [Temnothorax nylanderi]|uniref:uncharacterized protein isoform X2 n=1 Tax=Temnothorax nylanderi TaxID=102681 RepID=UPI003A8B4BE3